MKFEEIYKKLNSEQKEAVNEIYGPLLVIAGPGTGKTQLLSARVAKILQTTDTLPENILCLTFTENGARNMRDRLNSFIGQDSFKVNISTYHGFGRDLIANNREYFNERVLDSALDEIRRHKIIKDIQDSLSYADVLKKDLITDIIASISEVKRALLTPQKLSQIAEKNIALEAKVNAKISDVFGGKRAPGTFKAAAPIYEKILKILEQNTDSEDSVKSSIEVYYDTLSDTYEEAANLQKSTPLSKWKNKYLKKNKNDQLELSGSLANKKMLSLANVLQKYQDKLEELELFDYDDMILEAIRALENNDDLRFSLQEKYLFILLDEYQDTSRAQSRLIELLTDNPIDEGRPNVMAVGDDDQAIYAFQGAENSNLQNFFDRYIDTKVINLTKNYRSSEDILYLAGNIARQLEDRFSDGFMGISKIISAANEPAKTEIERREFKSSVSENAWVAGRVAELLKAGEKPEEIAILAPKHKYLENMLPFLHELKVPIVYEKRENILETNEIYELSAMARLLAALAENSNDADNLWPEILSFDFWGLNPVDIWKLSWSAKNQKKTWVEVMEDNENFSYIADFFLAAALKTKTETLEKLLDYLTGAESLEANGKKLWSKFKDFYFKQDSLKFYKVLSNLTVLRDKLREYNKNSEKLGLQNFTNFLDEYQEAGIKIINTSPYNEAGAAVNVMTVYAAKGLEFKHVFIISADDYTWAVSKGNNNRLTLPVNLQHIRYTGATVDEKIRVLFVAITRAKSHLYITSSRSDFTGKEIARMRFMDEREVEEQGKKAVKNFTLPEKYAIIKQDENEAVTTEELSLNWRDKYLPTDVEMKDLLKPRLDGYKISPTHLNTFIDVVYGGPQAFYENTILKFPKAKNASGTFGDAIHASLDFLQKHPSKSVKEIVQFFTTYLSQQELSKNDLELLQERGERLLNTYLAQTDIFKNQRIASEINFADEIIKLGEVLLTGKIDRVEIDKEKKELVVVDFKTGPGYNTWGKMTPGLYKYKQQLYIYKLLAENSVKFKGYTVIGGRLEFVEPDNQDGETHSLELVFNDAEMKHVQQLLEAVWRHIMALDFPNISGYKKDIAGMHAFEEWLLDNFND